MNGQIKHKKRVADHGEVFTHEREVNAMLDLVKQETERIDSRFLEPACGTGNFLIEVLKRKLEIVRKKYKKGQYDYERYSLIAIASIYGVDLLEDNVVECQSRLKGIFVKEYRSLFKVAINNKFLEIIQYILEKNIVCGDALSLKNKKGRPLVFSEWSIPYNNSLIKRKDYSFENMINPQSIGAGIFVRSDAGETIAFPNILKDYPPINYMELDKYE